jgi:glycine oxidase
MSSKDVVIVGGGVIGLSVAYFLAKAKVSVTVIDSNAEGQASKAAAGMLAPLGESQEDSPFVPLAIKALQAWPSFVDEIRSDVQTELRINGPGMLRVAVNDEEELQLCQTFDWQKSFGLPIELLCPGDVRQIEPSLSHSVVRAILTRHEQHVEPRLLLDALRHACTRFGVVIVSNTVKEFVVDGDEVVGVRTPTATYSASKVIVAGGSWSGPLLRLLDYSLPVEPVRGQIVCYGPFNYPPLKYTIYAHTGYLVPRPNGMLLAGATTERVGFNSATTPEGLSALRSMATGLMPCLGEIETFTSWAGLRPVSRDSLPLIGKVPNWNNIFMSTGHGRNGILLAPYTGALIAEHISRGAELPAIFTPIRFSAGS